MWPLHDGEGEDKKRKEGECKGRLRKGRRGVLAQKGGLGLPSLKCGSPSLAPGISLASYILACFRRLWLQCVSDPYVWNNVIILTVRVKTEQVT